ncbi:MAG TPA: pyridoxal phosphate-dependent aminotransferase [Clostridiales bacterium]|nr:pyridoxal phosphate-dependent aminotransferase [Clostridiales bacterium]HQP68801.1 pyridoxal phosphate-dependent aminotransferase [Clostridiales bacterium]
MGKLKISSRNEIMQASPIRKLAPLAVKAKAEGVHVYHLNIGQPDIKTSQKMIDAYHNIPEVIEYGPSEGLHSYRKKLVQYYKKMKIDVNESNIFITTGGSEAIIFTLLSALSPGDEVIIPEPFYTNYNGFAVMAGVNVVPVTTNIENGFDLPDMKEFKAKLTPRTKAIVICNPGNPTGAVFKKERLQELVDFARKHDLYVISDEVYREFTYDCKATSILQFDDFEENAVMIDSTSKRYSACGSRVGCIVTRNKELLGLVLKFGQARLCPPSVDQQAAEAAVDTPDSYFEEVHKEYTKRRNVAYKELKKIPGAEVPMPMGAFYMVVGLPIDDADDFAKWLLTDFRHNKETTMVAPASGFYATPGLGKNQIRIAYVLKEADLIKAINILKIGLEEYKKKK